MELRSPGMERFKGAGVRSVAGVDPSSHSRLRTASDPAEHARRFTLVRKVLLDYVSATLVDAVLNRALKSRGLLPEQMAEHELQEVTSDVMVGLRLFVPEQRLSQLMLELAEVLDGTR